MISSIGDILKLIKRDVDKAHDGATAARASAWALGIAFEKYAEYIEVKHLVNGVLTIECASGAVIFELKLFRQTELIDELRSRGQKVSRINFVFVSALSRPKKPTVRELKSDEVPY